MVYGDGNPCLRHFQRPRRRSLPGPSDQPYEALPLGNGQLGAMVRNVPGVSDLTASLSIWNRKSKNYERMAFLARSLKPSARRHLVPKTAFIWPQWGWALA